MVDAVAEDILVLRYLGITPFHLFNVISLSEVVSPSIITSPSPPRPSASAAETSDEESGTKNSEHAVGNPITSDTPSFNTVPNHKVSAAIVGSKQVGLKQVGLKQVGLKQVGLKQVGLKYIRWS